MPPPARNALLEKTAPLSVKVIEELLLMEFKVRTSPVISSAHGRTSLFDVPEVPFLTILLAQMFAVFGPSALCQHLPASNGKLAGRGFC